MLCTRIYLGHASLTTIRRDFGHEFTGCKFPNPPKFVVDLPQSVLECVFNAQGLTETNDCLCACGGDTPALASYNLQYVSFQHTPPPLLSLFHAQRCVRCCCEFRSVYTISAYKEAAHVSSVSNKAVCVCVCVQEVRSQDLLSLILGHSLRNCMR